MSNDLNGNPNIVRSYVATRTTEGLSLGDLTDPQETIVITEKWGMDSAGNAIDDSWLEPFKGDLGTDPGNPSRLVKAGNRHGGGLNCSFFDGHAKWYAPDDITASKDLTGCELVYAFPFPDDMTTSYVPTAPAQNICDPANPPHFVY